MESAVAALRERGEKFAMALTTLAGRPIEADGQVVGGRAILRLKDVSGVKRELAELDRPLPAPGRRRRRHAHAGRSAAVADLGARRGRQAHLRQRRLCARGRRQGSPARRSRAASSCSTAPRAPTCSAPTKPSRPSPAGCPRSSPAAAASSSTCSTFPTRRGSAGIGIDATEADAMRAELKRMVDAHRRTLDYLATGVAIFGADGRLTFYNTAFRSLWDLDVGVPRPEPERFRDPRPAARRAPAAGAAGLPQMEGRAARGLPGDGGQEHTNGTCPTAARCASSPRPIRKAA